MTYLLFPGRHLVNTVFQERYLKRVLGGPVESLPGYRPGRSPCLDPPGEVIFAITSANQENSRFNPVPFHIRAVGVDRFARQLRASIGFRYRVFGIPHYGHTQSFAGFTIKEIALQSEHSIELTPANCQVLCSTPEVIRLYQELRFAIAPAELAEPAPHPPTPIDLIGEIGFRGSDWRSSPPDFGQPCFQPCEPV